MAEQVVLWCVSGVCGFIEAARFRATLITNLQFPIPYSADILPAIRHLWILQDRLLSGDRMDEKIPIWARETPLKSEQHRSMMPLPATKPPLRLLSASRLKTISY